MILSILIIAVCALLIAAIFVQNSKGGLSGRFSQVYQLVSVKRGTEFIEKFTWVLAIGLFFLSVILLH